MRNTKTFGLVLLVVFSMTSLCGCGNVAKRVSAKDAPKATSEEDAELLADDEEAINEIDMKNFFAIKAPDYTEVENIKADTNFDGSYYYEDMSSDGLTLITYMCGQNEIESDQEPDAYATSFVYDCVDKEASVTDCILDEKLSEKMSYPVYKLLWEKGSNEDTRQSVGVVVLTDNYTYYYGYSCPVDFYEENADLYEKGLSEIDWLELGYSDAEWKEAYATVVREWEMIHGDDSEIGYELAYIDPDDIPELVLIGDDVAWYGMNIYTFIDGVAVPMKIDETYVGSEESEFLSPGWQTKGDTYDEKSCIYLQTSGMMGSIQTTGYRMDGDTFNKVFYYELIDLSWDESIENPRTYTLEYKDADGKDVHIEHTLKEDEDYYELASIPEAAELENEIGFSLENLKTLNDGKLSFKEMMEILEN